MTFMVSHLVYGVSHEYSPYSHLERSLLGLCPVARGRSRLERLWWEHRHRVPQSLRRVPTADKVLCPVLRQEQPSITLSLELQGLPRAAEEVFPGGWLMSDSSGTLWYLVLSGDTWHGKPASLKQGQGDGDTVSAWIPSRPCLLELAVSPMQQSFIAPGAWFCSMVSRCTGYG